jgi:hypothetical protein
MDRHRIAVLLALLLCALARPALAHYGPPFPILVDKPAGPYIASVWADPNIGTGTYYVVLDVPKGHRLPAKTTVRIGVQPVSGRLPEVFYDAESQPVSEGLRFYTQVQFDRGEFWHTHVIIGGSEGGGELRTDVEATPAGILGPLGSLVYALPFLAVGFLWLKATLRRRKPPQQQMA